MRSWGATFVGEASPLELRLFPQVKHLFKRGVPVEQQIYSAGGYISAAPYELSPPQPSPKITSPDNR